MATNAATLPAQPVVESPLIYKQWSLTARIGLRLAFCYLILYNVPGAITYALPGQRYLDWPFNFVWHRITPWTAQHLFHFSGAQLTYFPRGSGDTALDFVQNFLFLVIAAGATILWSLLDRKRGEYGTLFAWLRLLVRFSLAFTLLIYGLDKILPNQFGTLSLAQLTETYGQSSPMGLLWTFMAASMPYTMFGGFAEAIAGVFLLFRRTTLLGSLIAAGVLLNVVMLNFCYDVPVKLYSTNLLLMALFLLLPDVSRLVNVFVRNREAAPADLTARLFSRRWMVITGRGLMAALVVYFVVSTAWASWGRFQRVRSSGEPPIYGVYVVDSLQLNGGVAAANDLSNPKWTQVIADRGFWMSKDVHGNRTYFAPHFSASEVSLFSWRDKSTIKLRYLQPTDQSLDLTGYVQGKLIEIRLHKLDSGNFLLTHRGFHWISEYPFNR